MTNLLIVEDDEKSLRSCIDMLQSLGGDVYIFAAQSAEDARDILSQHRIDGVFVDIDLPGMDGLSMVREIRKIERYHFLPVLFVSGTDGDHPETYKQYHNFSYIEKPYSKESFLKTSALFITEIEAQKKIFREAEKKEIAFRCGDDFIKIYFSDILFATTAGRKIKLVTRKNEYIRSDITLRNLITEISDTMFVMCGKSEAVNVTNIEKISPVRFSRKAWTIHFIDAPDVTCQLSYRNRAAIEVLMKNRL